MPAKYTESCEWLTTPRARLFLQYEQRVLRNLLPGLAGYRCVQVGVWGLDQCLLGHAGTLCQWRIGLGAASDADVRFDGRQLPLASASVDAMILAHGLEQVAEPHRLLRECARVLNDRGQLIVLAFNPLSLWALRQGLPARRYPCFTPCSSPPSAGRLCDWLRLLEFEPEQLWRFGLGFPFFGRAYQVGAGVRWLRPLAWTSQAYALVARRHVVPRTRVKARAGRARATATVGLARSASGRVTSRR